MKKLILLFCFLASMVFVTAAPVKADISIYTFDNLPQNTNSANGDIGEDQLYVVLSDVYLNDDFYSNPTVENAYLPPGDVVDDGEILFTFFNTGIYPCSIVDVYFYDGYFLNQIIALEASDGVAVEQDNMPFHLPGTEYLGLVEGLSVFDSAGSIPPELIVNGVEPGEWLEVTFSLLHIDSGDPDSPFYDFGDVSDALSLEEEHDLRIGLRVHFWYPECPDYPDTGLDGEEQFLNSPVPIPVPGAIFLGGIGVAFVGWFRRRRML